MKKICFMMILQISVMAFSVLFPIASLIAQPENTFLLFMREENGVASVFVLDANTGEERSITELVRTDGPTGHDFGWSPDGRLWAVNTLDGELRLQFFDAETGASSIFSDRFSLRTCASALGWSPDGQYLAYSTASDNQDEGLTIYSFEDDTSYTLPWIGQHFPYWSPDGNYMVIFDNYFMDETENSAKTRLLRSEDGSELLRRGTDYDAFNFAFSADNRFFAYEENETAWLYEFSTGENINLEIPTNVLQWSPSGRYLMIGTHHEVMYSTVIYDIEANQQFDLDYTGHFFDWTGDESMLLLGTDFQVFGEVAYPRSLMTYEMESGETKTIFETGTDSWVADVSQNGTWMVVTMHHSSEDPGLRFISDETVIEPAIRGNNVSVLWSPDGHWAGVTAEDDLYLFDTTTGSINRVLTASQPFWSPDSRYLAFISEEQLYLWNTETGSIEAMTDDVSAIVGWQYGQNQADLTCSSGYADGNP